jgi:hypothetical protein
MPVEDTKVRIVASISTTSDPQAGHEIIRNFLLFIKKTKVKITPQKSRPSGRVEARYPAELGLRSTHPNESMGEDDTAQDE